MDSSFGPSTALGRSAPVFAFSNSGPRTVSITLEFHRDMFEELNPMAMFDGSDLKSKYMSTDKRFATGDDAAESFIHALQAIAVPKYNLSNKAIEPPLVAIRLGREVFIKGIVSGGVSVTYSKPILSNEKYAIVSVKFTVTEVDPYDATTVFKNGSFRGMVATMRTGMNF